MNEIVKRNLLLTREFTTVSGNKIELIGTVTLEVERDGRGFCLHGFGMRANGVCCECLLNHTVDILKVNGKNVDGGYRRGTVLKMAGLGCSGIDKICTNDKKVEAQVFTF